MTFNRRLSAVIVLAVAAGVTAVTLLATGAAGSPDAPPDPPTIEVGSDPPPPPQPSEHQQLELGDSKIVEEIEFVYRDGRVYEIPIKLKVEVVEFEDGARATRYSELTSDDDFNTELQRQIDAGEGHPADSIEEFIRQRESRDD